MSQTTNTEGRCPHLADHGSDATAGVADQFKPFDLTDPFPFYALAREQARA